MNFYTIYDSGTGEIISNGYSNAPLNEVYLEPGTSIIAGTYEKEEYIIQNGAAVASYSGPSNLDMVRSMRNELLRESDWTQLLDSPLTEIKKAEWVTYRQSLRDLTNGLSENVDISTVTFPTKPN